MSKYRVLIGLPTLGSVAVELAHSLLHATHMLAAKGIGWAMHWTDHVPQPAARNELVRVMLGLGASHLLMVDSDTEFEPEGLLRMLLRDRDMIGVPCQCRGDGRFAVRGARPVPGAPDLLEVDLTGAGMILLSRRWCQRMTAAHPTGPFEFQQLPTGFVDETFTACIRWRALGGRVWVDKSVRVGHLVQATLGTTWDEAQAAAQAGGKPVLTCDPPSPAKPADAA